MKFFYNIVNTDTIDINFQEIFDYVSKGLDNPSVLDVFNEFTENVGYYIRSIYDDNFEEDYNIFEIEDLITALEKWLEEKFGEGWNEELCD